MQQPSCLPRRFQPAPRRVQQCAPHGDALAFVFTVSLREDLRRAHGGKLLNVPRAEGFREFAQQQRRVGIGVLRKALYRQLRLFLHVHRQYDPGSWQVAAVAAVTALPRVLSDHHGRAAGRTAHTSHQPFFLCRAKILFEKS